MQTIDATIKSPSVLPKKHITSVDKRPNVIAVTFFIINLVPYCYHAIKYFEKVGESLGTLYL